MSSWRLITEVREVGAEKGQRIQVALREASALYWIRAEHCHLVDKLRQAAQAQIQVEVCCDPRSMEITEVVDGRPPDPGGHN